MSAATISLLALAGSALPWLWNSLAWTVDVPPVIGSETASPVEG